MLWHHMVVDGKVTRNIYESFGTEARSLLTQAIKAFPDYAYEIAKSRLIGYSDAFSIRENRIMSVYLAGAPEWYDGEADHHAMKLNLDLGTIDWKILWTPDQVEIDYEVPGELVWVGQNYNSKHKPDDEYHIYYDDVFDWDKRDLVGHAYRKSDNTLLYEKIYYHPAWTQVDDETYVTDWSHLPSDLMNLMPIHTCTSRDMEKTFGNQRIN